MKDIYRELCKIEDTIPVFSKPWWLDAVAANNWDVSIVDNGGEVKASMPYILKSKFGLRVIKQPPLTQNLGPWIRPTNLTYTKKLAREKDLMEQLIEQLPKHDIFRQSWHYSQTNWLPFYWKGFQQTTRYTYVIEGIKNLDIVFSNFDHSKRKNIKKAQKYVSVVFDISADEFYRNHKMTLAKQNAAISYNYKYFKRIYDAAYSNSSGKTIAAYDADGNLHAALFIIFDDMSAYDLISTIDPTYRKYGAASLLVKEAIRYSAQIVDKFDFEGSMIEPVERSFRRFGARQIPYYQVTGFRNRWLKAGWHMTEAGRALIKR
jgi:lipid II:glycine glycyltransferase (peptidoglycan interpeptide bridge formation enzyme)